VFLKPREASFILILFYFILKRKKKKRKVEGILFPLFPSGLNIDLKEYLNGI
jgi:hypothetical protein